MRNLLKTDMLRFLKTKQFLILAIICVVYALGYPALMYLFQELLNIANSQGGPIQLSFAKSFSYIHFSLGIPLLLSIIMFTTVLASEFSYGTVRNKIIAGYTRVQIYLSLLITLFVFMFSVIFISSLLSFGLAGILFYYDNIGGTFINDIGYYFIALVVSILIIAVYASIVCLFTIGLNKTALSIIMPIILIFVCLILEGIYEGLIETLINNNSQTNFIDILTFLKCFNLSYQSTALCNLRFEYYEILAFIFGPLGFAALLTFLGLFAFNKRDVK